MDENQLKKCREVVSKLTADQPRMYRDYQEMLAKEKPDIVIVATPDHWHALCYIEAIESGANVYVVKPLMEGRAMLNAARKHNPTVQIGTHRRVSPHNI